MLKHEKCIQNALKEAGFLAVQAAFEEFYMGGSIIMIGMVKMMSKGELQGSIGVKSIL